MSLEQHEAKLLSAISTPGSDAAKIARGLDWIVVGILVFRQLLLHIIFI
jgi:hypothetical protein